MIIPVSSLPSKGKIGDVSVGEIEVTSLTYGQLINYQHELESAKTDTEKLIVMIKHLVQPIKGAIGLSVYDLFAIIGLRILVTSASDFEKPFKISFYCPKCKSMSVGEVSILDMKYNELSDELLKIRGVILGGTEYKIHIPSIHHFLKMLEEYKTYFKHDGLKLIFIISLFTEMSSRVNDIVRSIKDASAMDSIVLESLYTDIYNPMRSVQIKCSNEHEGGDMLIDANINFSSISIFRLISLNNSVDMSKIITD